VRIKVCNASELSAGSKRRLRLDDRLPIAVFNVAGRFHVTDDECTHGLSSLGRDGALRGREVECAWHGGRFDVVTGAPTAPPCGVPLQTYPVEIDGDEVFAILPDPAI